MDTIRKAKWVFALLPVHCGDTDRYVWLRKVYREQWGYSKYYYENSIPF